MSCNSRCLVGEQDELAKLTKMEFAVRMKGASCADNIKSNLSSNPGVYDVFVGVADNLVLVESILKTTEIQALLEKTGLPVFFKGFGVGVSSEEETDSQSVHHKGAAIAALRGKGQLIGLLRMVQASSSKLIVEATFDGLPAGEYQVNIHEFGDLSHGGDSCGEVYGYSAEEEPVGCLGKCSADGSGLGAAIHVAVNRLQLAEVIGRSVVVVSSLSNERVMYGIIARSAGLFHNPKQLCTCDGVTIWDEANRTKTSINITNIM